jgi:hypothetical protein
MPLRELDLTDCYQIAAENLIPAREMLYGTWIRRP